MWKTFANIIKHGIVTILGDSGHRLIYSIVFYKHLRKTIQKAKHYNLKKQSIINRISKQKQINIIFFINNISMWKHDGLVKLLLNDERYRIYIIPFIDNTKDEDHNIKDNNQIIYYCELNNIPYRIGYNFKTKEYYDIQELNPDIVVYTQPYDNGYKKWRIDNFINKCLFIYTPYGLSVTKGRQLYDTYLMNIAWKIFVANGIEKEILIKNRSCKYNNVAITGAPICDQLNNARNGSSPWRTDSKFKIIWAPHHSIDSTNSFSTSNFLRISEQMIDLAKKYSAQIEVCFKPHPGLYDRLIEKRGKKWTDEYYNKWDTMENTFTCLGDYVNLFSFSDAMIHDCCSFIGEYLFVNKPVMYISKDKTPPKGIDNELGIMCYNMHYHGYEINDIESFIKSIVSNLDPMKEERTKFIQKNLVPPNSINVAQNMKNEIDKLFMKD